MNNGIKAAIVIAILVAAVAGATAYVLHEGGLLTSEQDQIDLYSYRNSDADKLTQELGFSKNKKNVYPTESLSIITCTEKGKVDQILLKGENTKGYCFHGISVDEEEEDALYNIKDTFTRQKTEDNEKDRTIEHTFYENGPSDGMMVLAVNYKGQVVSMLYSPTGGSVIKDAYKEEKAEAEAEEKEELSLPLRNNTAEELSDRETRMMVLGDSATSGLALRTGTYTAETDESTAQIKIELTEDDSFYIHAKALSKGDRYMGEAENFVTDHGNGYYTGSDLYGNGGFDLQVNEDGTLTFTSFPEHGKESEFDGLDATYTFKE